MGFDFFLNSGERIPSRLRHDGVREQDTKKVLDGIGFLVSFATRSFNSPATAGKLAEWKGWL